MANAISLYHADLSDAECTRCEDLFRSGAIRILVSTLALVLCFDKRDIHHVVHLYTPSSAVQYYQEIGRAGRDTALVPLARAHLYNTPPWFAQGWINVMKSITSTEQRQTAKC